MKGRWEKPTDEERAEGWRLIFREDKPWNVRLHEWMEQLPAWVFLLFAASEFFYGGLQLAQEPRTWYSTIFSIVMPIAGAQNLVRVNKRVRR